MTNRLLHRGPFRAVLPRTRFLLAAETVAALLAVLAVLSVGACASEADNEAAPAPEAEAPEAGAPAAAPVEPLGSGTIAGTIRYDGEPPAFPPLSMDADPACAAKHDSPVFPEVLVTGEQAGLANVLVYVADNLPGGPYPLAEPPVIDQQGCRYAPRVAGIMAGQELAVLNSDELLHNVHSLSTVNPPFNRAMPAAIQRATFSFAKAEPAFRIKCDVHPWMSTYLAVFSHPYFAVTGEDGSFEISGLPAGTYTLEAWHERLGTQRFAATLLDGATATADLAFAPPESPESE